MTRLNRALLAGVVASGIFSTILMSPTTAHENNHSKTTSHPTAKAQARHTATRAARMTPHEHVVRRAATPTVRHEATHAVTRTHFESRHSGGVARFTRPHGEHATSVTHVTIQRDTAMRLRDESTDRLRTMARAHPVVRNVTVRRVSLREITRRLPTLTNVTFLTGTIVRRDRDDVVLRTSSGRVIPIVTRIAVLNQTAFVPGTTVVVPAQFANGAFTLVPAFTAADEQETAAMPVVAPCALNDGDADDAGAVGTFAPVGACMNNDGDQDDGFAPPALPSGFLQTSVPSVFSNGFMPVVATGFVVAQQGPDVVIMTPNFTPLVVNASPAISNGSVGQLTSGRFVTISGFDVGNSLVATAIR